MSINKRSTSTLNQAIITPDNNRYTITTILIFLIRYQFGQSPTQDDWLIRTFSLFFLNGFIFVFLNLLLDFCSKNVFNTWICCFHFSTAVTFKGFGRRKVLRVVMGRQRRGPRERWWLPQEMVTFQSTQIGRVSSRGLTRLQTMDNRNPAAQILSYSFAGFLAP